MDKRSLDNPKKLRLLKKERRWGILHPLNVWQVGFQSQASGLLPKQDSTGTPSLWLKYR
jgi:hypothetical protein